MADQRVWEGMLRRQTSRRQVLKTGAAVGMGLAATSLPLGGCSTTTTEEKPKAESASKPKQGGVIRISHPTDPPHLDPGQTNSFATMDFVSLVYSRLLRYKTGPDVYPGDAIPTLDLAERFEQPDDSTYVFYLRKGTKFHNVPPVNGRELTSEDIKYTFDRLLTHEASPHKSTFAKVAKIETPDQYTVKFALKEPDAVFVSNVASPFAWIVCKEAVEQFGDLKTKAIGTGPFILQSYTRNVSGIFKKNPDYFIQGRPYLDEVQYMIIPDESTRIASFQAKEIDTGYYVTCDQAEQIKKAVPESVIDEALTAGTYIYLRTDIPPFNDVRIRQAISMGIDREAMMAAFNCGKGVPETFVPQGHKDWAVPWDQLGEGTKYLKRNVAEAKKLLAEAGFPNGLKTDLYVTTGYGSLIVSGAEMIKAQLQEIGIQCDLKTMEYSQYISTVFRGKYEGMAYGSAAFYADPNEYLAEMALPGGRFNNSMVNDPKLTEMVQKETRTTNRDERKKLVAEIEKYFQVQLYYIRTYARTVYYPSQPYVKGYRANLAYGVDEFVDTWLDK